MTPRSCGSRDPQSTWAIARRSWPPPRGTPSSRRTGGWPARCWTAASCSRWAGPRCGGTQGNLEGGGCHGCRVQAAAGRRSRRPSPL